MKDAETALVELGNESLLLHPARAAWWPRRSTLLLADTHFGKAATFRQAGLPVPYGTTARMLQRWTSLMQELRPDRMIILGDFVHSSTRSERDFEAELVEWRAGHSELNMVLVRGNHDRGHGELFSRLRLEVVAEPYRQDAFVLRHCPALPVEADGYSIAGHIHPMVSIDEPSGARLNLPCFHIAPREMVLPAFGEFTGSFKTVLNPGDRVFVIAGNAVLEATRNVTAVR